MQLRDDHRPVKVCCAFARSCPAASYQHSHRRAVRPEKPTTAEAQFALHSRLHAIPRFAWHLDADTHCSALTSAWNQVGADLVQPSGRAPRQAYANPEALQLISHRRALQEYLRAEDAERARRLLLIAWAAFRHALAGSVFTEVTRARADIWLTQIDQSRALAQAIFRWMGGQLRCAIAAGKRRYLQSLVEHAAGLRLNQAKELYGAVRKAFPAAKSARRGLLQPLPMLVDSTGRPMATPDERAECWRAHFAHQEAGDLVTEEEYSSRVRAQWQSCVLPFSDSDRTGSAASQKGQGSRARQSHSRNIEALCARFCTTAGATHA